MLFTLSNTILITDIWLFLQRGKPSCRL